ncbi:MAG TPA: alpha-L-fucosidase [Terracidiphilus sp.]
MNRRSVLKFITAPAIGAALNGMTPSFATVAPPVGPATELTPALDAYQKLRFGCSFHFGMPNFTGDDYDVGRVPASTYNPTHLNVRQWIKVAHSLGAKYAILVAKYMSGFTLWPSKGYDYSVANSGNKTDVVRAFVDACNEFGLKAGFYYCILDPHNEGTFEKFDWDSLISDQYFNTIKRHVAELHSLYPNTFYQLFDITWKLKPEQRAELYSLVKQHSPDCIIVMNQGFRQSRVNQGRSSEKASWPCDVINGEDTLPPLDGHDPHVKFEGKQYYMPFETWLPTGPVYPPMPWMHTWFWHPWYKTQPAEVIAKSYEICMGSNANLLLNLTPDNTGRIPEEQVTTMTRVAELIHR